MFFFFFFFFNDTATTEIYTLSLHDALPISRLSISVMARRQSGPSASARGGRGSLLACADNRDGTSTSTAPGIIPTAQTLDSPGDSPRRRDVSESHWHRFAGRHHGGSGYTNRLECCAPSCSGATGGDRSAGVAHPGHRACA